MTIQQAIAKVDELKPNAYSQDVKISWLSRLEFRIFNEIIAKHEYNEDEEPIEFSGYTEEDGEKELIAGQPYDEMYIHWLETQIDYNNMEFDNFNNSNSMFEAIFSRFRNAYNESHMSKGSRKIYY